MLRRVRVKVIGKDESSQESGGDEQGSDSAEARDLEVESGFTSGVDSIDTRYTLAGARVTNPNADVAAYDVQVLFNLLGKDGQVLDSQTETVAYVGPNESVPVAPLQIGFDLKVEPTDLEVQVVGDFSDDEGPRGSLGGDGAILDFKGGQVTQSDFGPELSAQVTNTTDAVAEFASWACIYVNGKKIVGGSSSSIVDPIPPGTTVEFGEPLSVELAVKKIQCRVVTDL